MEISRLFNTYLVTNQTIHGLICKIKKVHHNINNPHTFFSLPLVKILSYEISMANLVVFVKHWTWGTKITMWYGQFIQEEKCGEYNLKCCLSAHYDNQFITLSTRLSQFPYFNRSYVIQQITENGWDNIWNNEFDVLLSLQNIWMKLLPPCSWILWSSLINFLIPFWFVKLALDWDEKLDCIFFNKLYKMVSGMLRRKKNKTTTTT